MTPLSADKSEDGVRFKLVNELFRADGAPPLVAGRVTRPSVRRY